MSLLLVGYFETKCRRRSDRLTCSLNFDTLVTSVVGCCYIIPEENGDAKSQMSNTAVCTISR